MPVYENKVTALIGPSGCGKSTFLRCFNRMHDLYPGNRYEGEIVLHPDNTNLLAATSTRSRCACASAWCSRSPTRSRSRSTRTSPTACACAASTARTLLDEKVEAGAARRGAVGRGQGPAERAGVRTSPAASSSACASPARSPPTPRSCCSTSRPRRSTRSPPRASRSSITELKKKVTILIVTHNMQQAARVSDYTAYMYLGELVEFGQHRQDLHQAAQEANRGLHHRPLRLTRQAREHQHERPHLQAVRRRDGGDPQRRALDGRARREADRRAAIEALGEDEDPRLIDAVGADEQRDQPAAGRRSTSCARRSSRGGSRRRSTCA